MGVIRPGMGFMSASLKEFEKGLVTGVRDYSIGNHIASEGLLKKMEYKRLPQLLIIQATGFDAIRKGDDVMLNTVASSGKTTCYILVPIDRLIDANVAERS